MTNNTKTINCRQLNFWNVLKSIFETNTDTVLHLKIKKAEKFFKSFTTLIKQISKVVKSVTGKNNWTVIVTKQNLFSLKCSTEKTHLTTNYNENLKSVLLLLLCCVGA